MAPMTNRGKIQKYFYGLTIETNNFAFEVKVILGLESTHPNGWMGGWISWIGGWISWKYSHFSPAKAGTWAELGNYARYQGVKPCLLPQNTPPNVRELNLSIKNTSNNILY